MTTITATTHAKQDESLRELSADELDQIAGASILSWPASALASAKKSPEIQLTISDITVGGVPIK
jgi:hypothetical protein